MKSKDIKVKFGLNLKIEKKIDYRFFWFMITFKLPKIQSI